MAQLEESLNKLQQFPFVYGDEFNMYYPLMDDLGLLKRLISRFMDKYEMNSSSTPMSRLASFSSPQSRHHFISFHLYRQQKLFFPTSNKNL
uniref:Ovule protein n=1 Tax=Loa loa TaxID=7209 RepID=A0A1I7VYC5_LOALO